MGGPRVGALLVLTAALVAACSDRQSDEPTGPDASAKVQPSAGPAGSCNFTTVANLTKTEFGPSSAQSKQASDMKTAGAGTAQATSLGFQILASIGDKYDGSQTTANASALTVALLKCMDIGGATVPDSAVFSQALGANGAYAVVTPSDVGPVTSHHNGDWQLEPPGGATATWGDILPTGVNAILVYGMPVNISNFSADDPLSNIFDWNTLRKVTFNDPGVLISQCTAPSSFLQHNTGSSAEVLGFLTSSCFVADALITEPAATTWSGRLFRFFSPTPAYAALAVTTGTTGSKRTLSPFQVIGPDSVELKDTLFTWKKSGNTLGVALQQTQTPMYQIKSQGGTRWLQDLVLIWLEAVNNQGTNVEMCNNWAYTNADGIAQFPNTFFNKSGGYTIIAKTTGTVSKFDVTGAEIPAVPPGRSLLSTLVNVKNGTLGTCRAFHEGNDPSAFESSVNGFRAVGP
jgi:hypothetical protein